MSFGIVPSDVPLRALSLIEDSTNTSASPFHVLSQDVMLAAALDEIVFDCTLVGRRLSPHDSFCFRSPLFLVLVYSLPNLTTLDTLTTSSTSSVSMTVGAADTPWHPQFFFCAVTFGFCV